MPFEVTLDPSYRLKACWGAVRRSSMMAQEASVRIRERGRSEVSRLSFVCPRQRVESSEAIARLGPVQHIKTEICWLVPDLDERRKMLFLGTCRSRPSRASTRVCRPLFSLGDVTMAFAEVTLLWCDEYQQCFVGRTRDSK